MVDLALSIAGLRKEVRCQFVICIPPCIVLVWDVVYVSNLRPIAFVCGKEGIRECNRPGNAKACRPVCDEVRK